MPQTGQDLPKLFRSLGRLVADPRSVSQAESNDAEKRWPLLKAMPPKEPAPIPELTTQEKQKWQTQEPSEKATRKQRLSLPGLGDHLAQGLQKMSTRAKTEYQPDEPNEQFVTEPAAKPLPRQFPFTRGETGASTTSVLPAQQEPAEPVIKKRAVELASIFSKNEPEATANPPQELPADDSLKSIFSRLADFGKVPLPLTPPEKRPSYFGRLGKR